MTIGGALSDLNNLLKADDIPSYYKPSIKAVMNTIELERESITWIVGKDNCQVAVRNMPIDKVQKICAIIGEEEQQPCDDCISLNKLDDIITKAIDDSENQTECQTLRWVLDVMSELPSVTPSIKEWLSSFNTYSATECFTAVQELKKLYSKEVEE